MKKKILYVKITPGASENKVIDDQMDFFSNEFRILKVKTTSIPENGKANESLIKILSDYLKIPKSKIKILSGQKSREKKIEYEDH